MLCFIFTKFILLENEFAPFRDISEKKKSQYLSVQNEKFHLTGAFAIIYPSSSNLCYLLWFLP